MLSEFKGLLFLIGSANVKPSLIKRLTSDEDEPAARSVTTETQPRELEKYRLLCGDIQEIESVFIDIKDNQSDQSSDEGRRKLRGGLIPDKYLVPLKVFLSNSIY